MQPQQAVFTNTQGLPIATRRWLPAAAAPKAVILLVHGLAEHSGRYQPLAEYLIARGYGLCGLDLPGHGQSGGTPGFIASFDHYLQTVDLYLEQLQRDYPGTPLFLLGHSMGGLISTRLLLQRQQAFTGALLSGAAIQSQLQPPAIQMLIIRLLSLLAPKLGVLKLDGEGVSRDPAVVADYDADPLNYRGKISARSVAELFASMAYVNQHASNITLPMLIMHGEADNMAAAAGSQWLHDTISAGDKTVRIYPELFHEILNEPEKLQIFAEIEQWLNQRV